MSMRTAITAARIFEQSKGFIFCLPNRIIRDKR